MIDPEMVHEMSFIHMLSYRHNLLVGITKRFVPSITAAACTVSALSYGPKYKPRNIVQT